MANSETVKSDSEAPASPRLEMTPAMAKAVLKVAEEANRRECLQEIQAVLERRGLALEPRPFIDEGGCIRASISLGPRGGAGTA